MKQISSDLKILSTTIEVLRFPLALAVIFIHMGPSVVNLIDAKFSLFTHEGLYNLIGIVFSHVLTHIAVPCFFLISGFLFFLNFRKWSWLEYRKKMKSRLTTLFIPYILWNVTPWLLAIIKKGVKAVYDNSMVGQLRQYVIDCNFNILYDCNQWGGERTNWLGKHLLMTGPYDFPLWVLRDLIFMSVLTPIIYYLVKRLKLWYIVVLFMAYISRIWILIPGLHITACFYFSLGAFLSLNRINIISSIHKFRYIIVPLSIILFILCVIYDGMNTVMGQNIYPFFIFTTVFSVFYIVALVVEKYDIKPNKLLVSSCFFIYAFHALSLPGIGSPLSLCTRVLNTLFPDFLIANYLIVPFVTAVVCILIMQIGKKILPGVTKWYAGNR